MHPKILVALGTRPEALKLAPVITELRSRPNSFQLTVLLTGQHRHLVAPILRHFGIAADLDLDLMQPGQDPSHLTARILDAVEPVLASLEPDLVVVQGDTTTTFAVALAAHYGKVRVAHVEAGLRTPDRYDPFPEEMNRRLVTQLASIHLAATEGNRATLLGEGISGDSIFVTGNPIIDALETITHGKYDAALDSRFHLDESTTLIVLTAHRRENFNEGLGNIFRAVGRIVERHPSVVVVYPVHPNPMVSRAIARDLPDHPRIHRVEPLDYVEFIQLMNRAKFIMTDSGGIQEEAPALGKPVLVLRRTTERSEVLEAGNGILTGIEEAAIVNAAERLLSDAEHYESLSRPSHPFGLPGAARRIVDVLAGVLGSA